MSNRVLKDINDVSPDLALLEEDYESGIVSDDAIKDALKKVNPVDLTDYLPRSHLFEDLIKNRDAFQKLDSGLDMEFRDTDEEDGINLWGILYNAISRDATQEKLLGLIRDAKIKASDDDEIMRKQSLIRFLKMKTIGGEDDDKVSETRGSVKGG